MKSGYEVFGKACGVMLRNDLHAPESIDHDFMREMILLDEESKEVLYQAPCREEDMSEQDKSRKQKIKHLPLPVLFLVNCVHPLLKAFEKGCGEKLFLKSFSPQTFIFQIYSPRRGQRKHPRRHPRR